MTTAQLAKIANIRTRQIQRILDKGAVDLGATRTPGGHWVIPDTPAARKWAKGHQRWKRPAAARFVPEPPVDSDVVTHHEDGSLTWGDQVSRDQWSAAHIRLMPRKRPLTAWRNSSRAYGLGRWGMKFVAQAEARMEIAMGIEDKPKPANVNPADKSRGIISIEGISQSFDLWHRKMAPEIHQWNEHKIERGIALLAKQAAVHAELVALRDQLKLRK